MITNVLDLIRCGLDKLLDGFVDGILHLNTETLESTGLAITADLNGDGYPDAVTSSTVYLNQGSGDFHNVIGMPYWAPESVDVIADTAVPSVLTSMDIDSDGDMDLIVATDTPNAADDASASPPKRTGR